MGTGGDQYDNLSWAILHIVVEQAKKAESQWKKELDIYYNPVYMRDSTWIRLQLNAPYPDM